MCINKQCNYFFKLLIFLSIFTFINMSPVKIIKYFGSDDVGLRIRSDPDLNSMPNPATNDRSYVDRYERQRFFSELEVYFTYEAFPPRKSSYDQEKSKNATETKSKPAKTVEDWCVIWYLGAFGSLICFFLVITCTELFLGNPFYRNRNLNTYSSSRRENIQTPCKEVTPPPPYHLFAPPDYKDVMMKQIIDHPKLVEVFLVPIHGGKKIKHSII